MLSLWLWCASCEISWDIRCRASICQISAHCTTPGSQPPCRDSNLRGLSKNEIFSLLLLLLLPDLIWSLEIISNAPTLLSKYVNIIANYFLAPCTFYFRRKIEFIFLKSEFTLVTGQPCWLLHSSPHGRLQGSKWITMLVDLLRTSHNITPHNNVMLPLSLLSYPNLAVVCSYKVYCSLAPAPARVLTDNLIR